LDPIPVTQGTTGNRFTLAQVFFSLFRIAEHESAINIHNFFIRPQSQNQVLFWSKKWLDKLTKVTFHLRFARSAWSFGLACGACGCLRDELDKVWYNCTG
jgi:hypothetical protein